MKIQALPASLDGIEPLRALYREESGCQIVCDSLARRGLAACYSVSIDGTLAAYAAVRVKIDPGRLVEFYAYPHFREYQSELFAEALKISGADSIQAQTNIPIMRAMLNEFGADPTVEAFLFDDRLTTKLQSPGGQFRARRPEDVLPTDYEPAGDWVVELYGKIVAQGGVLLHYNPPYGDVFMEVAKSARRNGYGAYLVQELKRIAYEMGRKPAARCPISNVASRRTLERAGLLHCGEIVIAKVP